MLSLNVDVPFFIKGTLKVHFSRIHKPKSAIFGIEFAENRVFFGIGGENRL